MCVLMYCSPVNKNDALCELDYNNCILVRYSNCMLAFNYCKSIACGVIASSTASLEIIYIVPGTSICDVLCRHRERVDGGD